MSACASFILCEPGTLVKLFVTIRGLSTYTTAYADGERVQGRGTGEGDRGVGQGGHTSPSKKVLLLNVKGGYIT